MCAKAVRLRHNFTGNSEVEIFCVSIQFNNYKSILTCSIYRPKFYLTNEDIDELETLIAELQQQAKWWCIGGDFNLHIENTDEKMIKKLLKMIHRNNGQIIKTGATRGNACLDFFIVRDDARISKTWILDPNLSDHRLNLLRLEYPKQSKPTMRKVPRRNYRSLDYQKLGEEVIASDFISESDNVDDNIETFLSTHLEISNSLAPLQLKKVNTTNLKTMILSAETLTTMRMLDNAYKKWKTTNRKEHESEYMQLKLECRQHLKSETKKILQ